MVLQPLLFVGTSDGDSQMFPMALIRQSTRHWLLSVSGYTAFALSKDWKLRSSGFSTSTAVRLIPSAPLSHGLTSYETDLLLV